MDNVGLTDASTQLGINAGMKTVALCENFIFAFFIDKLGRRPIYLISTIGTFVTFNIWTIISARYEIKPQNGLGYGFVVMIFLYGLFYDIKTGLLASYSTEILPYGLRAKGYVWLNFCVTAALFFNQFVNGIALDALAWKYYIFYCVFLAFEIGVIYFFIVETRYVLSFSSYRRCAAMTWLADLTADILPWKRLQSSLTGRIPLMSGRWRWRI